MARHPSADTLPLTLVRGTPVISVGHLSGVLFALDRRWVEPRSWLVLGAVACAAVMATSAAAPGSPVWAYALAGPVMLLAVVLTSLTHEMGHVAASLAQGISVRAVVMAPQGGLTVRASAHAPQADLLAALGGPIANLLLGLACLIPALALEPVAFLRQMLLQVVVLQVATAAVNMLPWGAMDGQRILSAWRDATR